jgi:hypothetical protein
MVRLFRGCSFSPSSRLRSSSADEVVKRRLQPLLMLAPLLTLQVAMLQLVAVTPALKPVSSSSFTSHPAKILLLSYETQCVSSMPDPSSTTTTDPTDGSTPLPCDLLGAQAAQDHTFLAVLGIALVGFLLAVLVGLRLWS